MLLALAGAVAGLLAPSAAMAKDGGSDGGDSDSGKGDGDSDDHDDDGGDNGGKGRGRGRGRGHDDDDDVSSSGAGNAVRSGEIIPLKKALEILAQTTDGKVIDVRLSRTNGNYVYAIKIRGAGGRVLTHRMNARTGRKIFSTGAGS